MQGLKHNMYKNMCEGALKTAGNLDGDNDAEPIYANHVTNMIMAYETYGTPDVRPSSAHARLTRLLCAAARPQTSRESNARKLLATHLAGRHDHASDPHRVAHDRAHGRVRLHLVRQDVVGRPLQLCLRRDLSIQARKDEDRPIHSGHDTPLVLV